MSVGAEIRLLHQPLKSQVETRFDSGLGIYWAHMIPIPRPCFNVALLDELNNFVTTIQRGFGRDSVHYGNQICYAVLASKTPGVFNLGGDLALFRTLIQLQDHASL